MAAQTLENGDPFERKHADWIRAHLPKYEETWSTYIGNDGNSSAIQIRGLSAEQNTNRGMFIQCHYSVALFTFLFQQRSVRSVERLREGVGANQHRSIEAYLSYTEDFTLYLALLGQVCDMLEQIGPSLNQGSMISAPAAALMKQRNHAIHTARIPMGWDYLGVKISRIAKLGETEGGWRKGARWDSMDPQDYVYLAEWMEDTLASLLAVLKYTVSPMILKAARDYFGPVGIVCQSTMPARSSSRTSKGNGRAESTGDDFPSGISGSFSGS